jgi:hypothetical protein
LVFISVARAHRYDHPKFKSILWMSNLQDSQYDSGK